MPNYVRRMADIGFLIGLVFALFLAGKIVPYLILVGVVPLFIFWARSDCESLAIKPYRLFMPTLGYLAFCTALYLFYPGLPQGQTPPGNPDLELYLVAAALLCVGFLRGLQINDLPRHFHNVVPYALFASFLVLGTYMGLGLNGCRVYVAASWPFIPAVIFTTLTFLLLLDWEIHSSASKLVRLGLISVSIVVVLAFTAARGVAVGQFSVLFLLLLLSRKVSLRTHLPNTKGLLVSIILGLLLTAGTAYSTGCHNLGRLPAIFDTLVNSVKHIASAPSQTSVDSSPQVQNADAAARIDAQLGAELSLKTDDAAISERLDMWQASIEAIIDAPIFGHGALSLKPIIQDRFKYEHNHNQYLAWLVTGGIVLLIVGLSFIATPLWISSHLTLPNRIIAGLAASGIWSISMIFDAFLSLDFYLHYFSLLLGFLFALFNKMGRHPNESDVK